MARKDRPPLPPYVPARLRERMDMLERDTGVKPVLTQPNPHVWHVVLQGEHARLTMSYARRPGGGKKYDYESTLEIDGKPRDLAEDYHHFMEIWRRAEEGKLQEPLEPLEPMGDMESAPMMIRKTFEAMFVRREEGQELAVWPEDDHWIIGINFEDMNAFVRLRYEINDKGIWIPAGARMIRDGVDRSGELGKNFIQTILAMMGGGGSTPSTSVPGMQGTPSAPGMSNSVQVRKSTVFRI